MARIATGLWGIAFSFLVVTPVFAYVQMRTGSGTPIEWKRNSETSSFRTHYVLVPENRSGLDAATVKASVVRGLERWFEAGLGNVLFDVWTGSDSSVYSAGTSYDGYSKIYFSSQRSNQLSPGVIGYTQVWHNSQSGQILEADMELNDLDFAFTTTPTDSTGTGNGMNVTVTADGKRKVFLENVLTHELGHTLGLGHSGVMQSTMLPYEAPGQARLSCDDRTGVQSLYPVSNTLYGRGAVSGVVVSESGQAVFGAHVELISRRRGVVLASGVTDSRGGFNIEGVATGEYAVVVSPFAAGASALPAYYAGANPRVCANGAVFVRSFQTVDGSAQGLLRLAAVTGGRTQDVGQVVARCSNPGFATEAASLSSGQGVVLAGDSRDVAIQHAGGALEVKVLAHSLYYSRSAAVDLVDAAGRPVDMTVVYPSFLSSSGYRNFDVHGRVASLAAGTYTLRVRLGALSGAWTPGGAQSMASVFVVFAISGEGAPSFTSELPWNARCEAADVDTHYVSPSGIPPKGPGVNPMGCGTIQKVGAGSSSGPGDGMRGAASWFLSLGWIFALSAVRLRRAWMHVSL